MFPSSIFRSVAPPTVHQALAQQAAQFHCPSHVPSRSAPYEEQLYRSFYTAKKQKMEPVGPGPAQPVPADPADTTAKLRASAAPEEKLFSTNYGRDHVAGVMDVDEFCECFRTLYPESQAAKFQANHGHVAVRCTHQWMHLWLGSVDKDKRFAVLTSPSTHWWLAYKHATEWGTELQLWSPRQGSDKPEWLRLLQTHMDSAVVRPKPEIRIRFISWRVFSNDLASDRASKAREMEMAVALHVDPVSESKHRWLGESGEAPPGSKWKDATLKIGWMCLDAPLAKQSKIPTSSISELNVRNTSSFFAAAVK